ncbi:MAG: transcriptional regulator [Candidatus Gottesmanbacteria bacterium GW2011_GWB1_49_7]|uniref:Transcriptional regulator n=1 Tax=Candidatus Gottesmanbacteria bacterium GW2011_GWB1_49_7 TaxID=1618448 RepID=A0A0G1VUP1_9BACT|nr:MAG: transcriptional regulator [Candidatus Gottesmanbacteria bacterium GW2011_GWB1_49_7]
MKSKEIAGLDEARKHPAYKKVYEVMDARMKLAIEISEQRAHMGWSQQELAKKAETTQKVISKIENGDTNVGFDLLKRITSRLNLMFQIGQTVFVNKIETTTNVVKTSRNDFGSSWPFVHAGSESGNVSVKDLTESREAVTY